MFKDVFIELIADLVEIIHVELTNKRREVTMPKICWQNLLLEPFNIKDGKISSFLVPTHDS